MLSSFLGIFRRNFNKSKEFLFVMEKKRNGHNPLGMLLKDAVFGVNDGIVSMLALVAGLSAASMTRQVVVIAGFAEAFAGAISMAIGSYISTKSQVEFLKSELRSEDMALKKSPRVEKEHLRAIYAKRGLKGRELDCVVNAIISNKTVWKEVMQKEELGFSETILENPLKGAVVMFVAFTLASMVPLIPYLYATPGPLAFTFSLFNGFVVLFLVGVGKTYFTGKNKLASGLEMIVVGGIATALAYGIGTYLPLLFH
jgi:VIT1/CCC1 family predicted Fe2+/Mn2+ transporter